MDIPIQKIYNFLTVSRGNWRNSIYISGKDSPHGFLLAPDRDGKPVIVEAGTLQQLSGEQIDPAECRGQLTESDFRDLFDLYLLWQFPNAETDVLMELSR